MHQVMKILGRQETEVDYIIFDSTLAVEQAVTGRASPGQALARAIIELEELLIEKVCSVITRWTPAHKGVEETNWPTRTRSGQPSHIKSSGAGVPIGGKPGPPRTRDDRGPIPVRQRVDPEPHQEQPAALPPKGRQDPPGPTKGEEGDSQQIFPTPL